MKFETLSSGKKRFWKRLSLGISLFAVVLVGVLTLCFSYAKYRNTESIELASGTVNFSLADFNLLAVNVKHVDEYGALTGDYGREDVPIGNYKINDQSYCEVGEQKVYGTSSDGSVNVEYTGTSLTFSGVNKSNTKCYIYLDEYSPAKEMLAKLETARSHTFTIEKMPSPITGAYKGPTEDQDISKDKLYISPDNYGTSYVFRGNNNDVHNWVKFAGHTWRIIRINGDGTLRLIFQCATEDCTDTLGATTNAVGGTAYKPAPYDDNTYVGYYYGTAKSEEHPNPKYEEAHSNETPSNIANAVQTWYTGTGKMNDYTEYLDGNTGWCNDRTVVKKVWNGYEGDGTAQTATGYAPASRLIPTGGWRTNQYPTLKCGAVMPETSPSNADGFESFDEINPTALARDLFTTSGSDRGNGKLPVPAALITSDEVVMAGGFGGTASTDYWLYTNQYYWTMSPWSYDVGNKWAGMFAVRTGGALGAASVQNTPSVRPVVNLKADTTFSGGDGKSSSPFVVASR